MKFRKFLPLWSVLFGLAAALVCAFSWSYELGDSYRMLRINGMTLTSFFNFFPLMFARICSTGGCSFNTWQLTVFTFFSASVYAYLIMSLVVRGRVKTNIYALKLIAALVLILLYASVTFISAILLTMT